MNKSFWQSLRAAGTGVVWTVKCERNMRIHIAVFVLVLLYEFIVRPPLETVIIVLIISGVVMSLELTNTALEATVDLLTNGEHSELARIAKDAAAGSVLVAAVCSLLVAVYLLSRTWPLHWLLWSRVHWLGALINGVALVLCAAAALGTAALENGRKQVSEGGGFNGES